MEPEPEARLRLLVADDDAAPRDAAQEVLGNDFDLTAAATGDKAWAAVTSDPDLLVVFVDTAMPGLDGFELLERIRADERAAIHELPVIMMTPGDDASARQEALKRGATDFISKPLDPGELSARARAYATPERVRRHAQALSTSQLQDSVTGLGTRAYFDKRLESVLGQCRRQRTPLTVVQIEPIGVSVGMAGERAQSGSRVLREAGQCLAQRMRSHDVLARLGANRFGAICPDCGPSGASRVLGRLLESLRGASFAGDTVHLGAIGGAYIGPGPPGTGVGGVFLAGERALEQARTAGDGAIVIDDEAAIAAGSGNDRVEPALAEAPQTLAEIARMLEAPDGAARFGARLPQLLEACTRVLEAAPTDEAAAYRERVRRLDNGTAD
jgi:diguanylate cyclase (GGDEF)-like protein